MNWRRGADAWPIKRRRCKSCRKLLTCCGLRGYSFATYRCRVCSTDWEVELDEDEVRKIKAYMRESEAHSAKLHTLWHSFTKRFYNKEGTAYLYRGFDFMERVQRFAQRHEEIILIGCDDSNHTSSLIVLIPHQHEGEYWGTTVVCIPQTGGDPIDLFFYDHNVNDMLVALRAIKQAHQSGKLNLAAAKLPREHKPLIK